MSSTQPTHHGYAVMVKDYSGYDDAAPMTHDDVQALWDAHAEMFWADAQYLAKEHGFDGAYSAGRMSGWCQPYPQPRTDDMWEDEVAAWELERFRPFEAAIIALLEDARQCFAEDLEAHRATAEREPGEVAYWAARDVITVAA